MGKSKRRGRQVDVKDVVIRGLQDRLANVRAENQRNIQAAQVTHEKWESERARRLAVEAENLQLSADCRSLKARLLVVEGVLKNLETGV